MGYDRNKEIYEAIDAGEKALRNLRLAQQELSSARSWGIWDILGGGSISTLVKHSKMDKAKIYMERAKLDLNSFSKELRDVNMAVNLNINTSDFLEFADFFFDGFIADWLVQDKIREASCSVDEAIYRVEQIIDQLRSSI